MNQFHLLWCKQKRLRRQQQDNSPKRNGCAGGDYKPLSSSRLSWLIFPSVLVITGVRQYLQLIQVAQIVQLRAVCCVSLHSLTVRRGTGEAQEASSCSRLLHVFWPNCHTQTPWAWHEEPISLSGNCAPRLAAQTAFMRQHNWQIQH